jgi:MFS family permease
MSHFFGWLLIIVFPCSPIPWEDKVKPLILIASARWGRLVTYLGELRANWRYIAAACLGQIAGYNITYYIANVFAPYLLNAFGWSKAQFSLTGTVVLMSLICLPIGGRLTDIYGMRRMVRFGVFFTPLIYVAYSAMTGDISQYFAISIAMIVLVAPTTSSLVYGRLIAEEFRLARGAALGIAACAPPLAGAASVPFLNAFIEAHGWRNGYLLVAACFAVGGFLTVLLIPKSSRDTRLAAKAADRPAGTDYRAILRTPAFQIIVVGMFLCNLPFIMQGSQLMVILLEKGLTSATAAWMVSVYATGIVVGRILCGLALDRFPAPIVVAVGLGIPCIGLFILASALTHPMLIAVAVAILGLSMGAIADVMVYIVMRYFKVEIFSTVFGLIGVAVASSTALGSLILSLILKLSGSFSGFLYLSSATAMIGGSVFLLLGRQTVLDRNAEAPAALEPSPGV